MARWLLALILAAYVLLAVGYSLGTPPWEAPDEPSHYLYAEHIAARGSLPPEAQPQQGNFWEHGYVTSGYEWYQPPLYYTLVASLVAFMDWVRPGTIPQAFPPIDPAFPAGARNLFVHSSDDSLSAPGLRLARLFSVALGLCTLLVVYRATMLVSGRDPAVALTATGLMAFIPQYTFLSGYVTNDNLALLLSALSLLIFLDLLRSPDRQQTRLLVFAGALLSLALYTKLSLLFLLPLGLLCLLFRFTHHRSLRRWLSESVVLVAVAVVPFLLGLVVKPGLRDQVVYAYKSLQLNPEFMSSAYVVDLWPQTYTSFWGTFGWMNVSTPRWIAGLFTVVYALGLVGAMAQCAGRVRQSQTGRSSWRPFLLLWVACGLVAIGFVRFNLAVRQPQGRLLFAALPALVILVGMGYRRLSGRLFPLVGAAMVLFAFAANLLCLFGALLPAYAFPH